MSAQIKRKKRRKKLTLSNLYTFISDYVSRIIIIAMVIIRKQHMT